MAMPKQFQSIKKRFSKYLAAAEELGRAAKKSGPLNDKTGQLIQLAAAAAIGSEGSMHSHVRRAIKAGAKPAEVYHAVILLTSTIGFPKVSAAISCIDDVVECGGKKCK